MVEINATSAKIGDTVFTVSATDADSDQILYESSCSPSTTPDGNCPFEVYDCMYYLSLIHSLSND